MLSLIKQGDVHILTMETGEGNAVDLDFLNAMHESLDAIEAGSEGPCALVITGSGKAFSTGLNLPVLMNYTPEQLGELDVSLKRLYGRLVNFPVPTIAAINGHSFAAGAVLALACDFRVMRSDRGWFCFSEVDVNVPIGPEVMAIAQAKLSPTVIRDAILTGKRFSGEECAALGVVEAACSEEELLNKAVEIATPLAAKERAIFKSLKSTLYSPYAEALGVKE